jgi:hypothetical protein
MCLRQQVSIKDACEVAIPFNPPAWSALKLCLCQLRFDKKIPDAEVYLGALDVVCDKRDAWFVAELEALRRFRVEQETKRTLRRKCLRVAEDVHQKRIGARGSIQLSSFSVMTRKVAPRGTVRLLKAAVPFGLATNAPVRSRMEVSMSGV